MSKSELSLPTASVNDEDRDVVTGFPYGRLALLFANMMFIGGCVVLEAAFVAFDSYGYSDSPEEFFAEMSSWTEELWKTLVVEARNDRFGLALVLAPGTIIVPVWYLILRWRENVRVKKRRDSSSVRSEYR